MKAIVNNFTGKFDYILTASEIEALGFVPYSGATQDVDLGVYQITATGVKSKDDIVLTAGKKLIFDGA